MTNVLVKSYDRLLAGSVQELGYSRFAQGTYARSDDDVIWYGLQIIFHQTAVRLSVQPHLVVFCPLASRVVGDGLRKAYGDAVRDQGTKLGQALIMRPLYDCVRSLSGGEREPSSYNVATVDQISAATKLVCTDFKETADGFFGSIKSMDGLRDKIMEGASDTSAGINAMALSYVLDTKMSAEDVDRFTLVSPNPMTRKFAMYLKDRIGADRKKAGAV